MPGLVDVIHLHKSEFAQALGCLVHIRHAAAAQCYGVLVHILALSHALGYGFGIGHHPSQLFAFAPTIEHLGAQNLVGRVLLPVFYVALISRREYQHLTVVGYLAEVVI